MRKNNKNDVNYIENLVQYQNECAFETVNDISMQLPLQMQIIR